MRGFTAHPNSGVTDGRRGTYAGFIERIPYLVDLGVSAIELLPVFHLDRLAALPGRTNVWGYQPVAFFAPHLGYASRPDPLVAADELRDLIKALHRAGLEVILDVVYNHTAENGPDGPTFCFRGFANEEYYLLDGRGGYADYSGTGNSLDANASVVRRLIVDSLRFWVAEMHVDGFRFDLASVLSRDEDGRPLARPPILWDIDSDPVLSGTKLIAEAWDAAGLYQVGSFVGDRWVEWNGRFRDDVRAFVRGEPGRVWAVASGCRQPRPVRPRHREAQKRSTLSPATTGSRSPTWSATTASTTRRTARTTATGATTTQLELRRRGRDRRPRHRRAPPPAGANLLALTLLAAACRCCPWATSSGAPRTATTTPTARTTSSAGSTGRPSNVRPGCCASPRAHRGPAARPGAPRSPDRRDAGGAAGDGADRLARGRARPAGSLGPPRSLAATIRGRSVALHIIANAYWEPLDFALPPPDPTLSDAAGWRRLVDTTLHSPDDIRFGEEAPAVETSTYRVGPRSSLSLPPDPTPPTGPTRDHPGDAARSRARADGRARPPRGRPRYREPVVPVGSVPGRAGLGHGARGLQRRWRRVVVLPARSCPFAGLPLERGRDGRVLRRVRRWCLGLALWNGRDPILKERMFGLTDREGNHGEDVKEYWWYLDALPHAWNTWRYHYPQREFPYGDLVAENAEARSSSRIRAGRHRHLRRDRYWVVTVDYAKADPPDLLMRITVGTPARWRPPWMCCPRCGSATPGRGVTVLRIRISSRGRSLYGVHRSSGITPSMSGSGRTATAEFCSATTRPTRATVRRRRRPRRTRRTGSTTTCCTAPRPCPEGGTKAASWSG